MGKSIKEMREFLKNHKRYWTMNSWNRLHSFATNVKLHKINAPNEAYHFLECKEAFDDVNFLIDDFRERNDGYCIIQNGRSGGYLVLCKCDRTENGYRVHFNMIGDDIDSLTSHEVRELFHLVNDFDNTTKACCDSFLEFVKNHTLEERTILVPQKIQVAIEKSSVTA